MCDWKREYVIINQRGLRPSGYKGEPPNTSRMPVQGPSTCRGARSAIGDLSFLLKVAVSSQPPRTPV